MATSPVQHTPPEVSSPAIATMTLNSSSLTSIGSPVTQSTNTGTITAIQLPQMMAQPGAQSWQTLPVACMRTLGNHFVLSPQIATLPAAAATLPAGTTLAAMNGTTLAAMNGAMPQVIDLSRIGGSNLGAAIPQIISPFSLTGQMPVASEGGFPQQPYSIISIQMPTAAATSS